MTTTPVITFGNNALAIKDDILMVTGTFVQSFVDLDDLKVDGSVITVAYASYEPDFWLLNGNYHFLPTGSNHSGFISSQLSNENGVVLGGTPYIDISFNSTHFISGSLSINFSEFTGDYCNDVEVIFYNSVGTYIYDVEYSPTGTSFSANISLSGFKGFQLLFFGTNKPYRFQRVTSIEFDGVTIFSGENVRDAHLIEAIDPNAVELPVNTVDFTLFSDNGDFSIVAPTGVYASLQYKEPIDVHEIANGLKMYMGRFYLDEWSSESANLANFKASDAIGLLDSNVYLGNLWGNGILATGIFMDFFSNYNISYTLDTYWNTFGIAGYSSLSSAREGLQKMVFALLNNSESTKAVVSCVRSNKVNILAKPLASTLTSWDYLLTNADLGIDAKLTLKSPVTDVDVLGYSWFGTSGTTQIYNDVVPSGTTTITFDSGHSNYVVLGATLVDSGANYVTVSSPSSASITVTAKGIGLSAFLYSLHDDNVPSSSLANKVRIEDTLIPRDSSNPTAHICLKYFQQRYKLSAKVFAPTFKVGDAVLADVQNGKQLLGIVEKMDSDLARGFVSNVEIVGVIL